MEMGGKFGVLAELLLQEKVDEHALDFADHMRKKTRIKVLVLVFYFLIYDEMKEEECIKYETEKKAIPIY
jgi:hypothetical protein